MTSFHDRDRAHQERALHQSYEHFLKKWAPAVGASREFEADLYMLVRAIHQDAARPFGKMLEAALTAMPTAAMSVVVKTKAD